MFWDFAHHTFLSHFVKDLDTNPALPDQLLMHSEKAAFLGVFCLTFLILEEASLLHEMLLVEDEEAPPDQELAIQTLSYCLNEAAVYY